MLDFDPLSDSADDLSRSFDAFDIGDSELGAFAAGAGLTGALLRWWGKKKRDQELRDSNLRGSVSQEELTAFGRTQIAQRFGLEGRDLLMRETRWRQDIAAWGLYFTDTQNRHFLVWVQVFSRRLRVLSVTEKHPPNRNDDT